MYAPTSTISPRSRPSSGDAEDALTDFDGVAEVLRAWGTGLRPDPDLTVSECADRHRMLAPRPPMPHRLRKKLGTADRAHWGC